MKLRILLISILCNASFSTFAQTKNTTRVLLIPLDDRPPCLQFPVKMGLIGDVELVYPPQELLGRFTEPGNVAKLEEWLRAQDYRKVDALIVSLDMLAYGGLVASRTHAASEESALRQLEFFRWFKKKNPLAFASLYFLATFSVSSNILFLIGTGYGERLLYAPSLGFALAVAFGLSKWLKINELNQKSPLLLGILGLPKHGRG